MNAPAPTPEPPLERRYPALDTLRALVKTARASGFIDLFGVTVGKDTFGRLLDEAKGEFLLAREPAWDEFRINTVNGPLLITRTEE
jgi:hypothetical protein